MTRTRKSQERTMPKGTTVDVTVDITDGPSVEISKDGPRATRVARVSNLPGGGADRLWFAINAVGVPKYGDSHPVIPGLPVSRVSAVLASEGTTDIATVTCEYFYPTGGNLHFANIEDIRSAPRSMPQLEITSTVQPTTTQFHLDDQNQYHQIVLPYTRHPPTGASGPSQPLPLQPGNVEYQLPMMVFRFARREPADAYVGDAARDYVGTINSVAVFGETGVHYWMCTRIDGVSDDGGKTYNVTYEFQRNPDTWNPVVIYVDPNTQLPVTDAETLPPGLNVVNGIGRFRIYRATDFNGLGLNIPD